MGKGGVRVGMGIESVLSSRLTHDSYHLQYLLYLPNMFSSPSPRLT